MDMPIIFLAPPEYANMTGIQRVDDETHEVTAVILDDGTDMTKAACSYKAVNV